MNLLLTWCDAVDARISCRDLADYLGRGRPPGRQD